MPFKHMPLAQFRKKRASYMKQTGTLIKSLTIITADVLFLSHAYSVCSFSCLHVPCCHNRITCLLPFVLVGIVTAHLNWSLSQFIGEGSPLDKGVDFELK